MTDPSPPRDLVNFQLSLLDAYEKLLESCSWDQAKLNDVLKAVMSSFLPLLRAQREIREQLFASQKELIRQYRQSLEASLQQSDDQASSGATTAGPQ
jgi:hypothetical protein